MSGRRHPQEERGLWFARALVVLYLALIVHLTLLPAHFGVGAHRFAWHLVGMVLALAPRHVSLHLLSDVAANVVLYAPLGLLVAFAQRSPRPRGAAAGFVVSLGLELLQAATRDRVASLLDVAANGAGHVAGYRLALWLVSERGVSRAALVGGMGAHAPARAAGALRSAYVTALVALSLLPYDVTVSAGRLWAKALAYGSEPRRVYLFVATPWDASRAAGVVLALGLTIPVGALARLAAAGPPRWVWLALQGLLVATAVEGGQVLVASRTADVAQALAGVPGALLGAWLVGLGMRSDTAGPAPRASAVRALLLAAVASWAVLVWTEAWSPFELEPSWQQAARKLVFQTYWLPLSAHAAGPVAASAASDARSGCTCRSACCSARGPTATVRRRGAAVGCCRRSRSRPSGACSRPASA